MDTNLKLCDVRMRGRGYTLYPAAKEYGVKEEMASNILNAIYTQGGMYDKNGSYLWDMASQEKREQPMTMLFKSDMLDKSFVEEALKEDLLIKTEEGYEISKKMKEVLWRAATLQKQLDGSDFYVHPCGH